MNNTSFISGAQSTPNNSRAPGLRRLYSLLPWLVLIILLHFTISFFWWAPYTGFRVAEPDGEIVEVYTRSDAGQLQMGDRLVRVGDVAWSDFASNPWQVLFAETEVNDTVTLQIERGERLLTIPWRFPGPTLTEFLSRFNSEWWLAYVFWVAGVVTFLFIRPRDSRWKLLMAFNFVTAIWLAAGGVAQRHVGGSVFAFRSALWLALPVYLHLHWVFPNPLGRLPAWLLGALYVPSIVMAAAEWLQLVPSNTFEIVFLAAIAGSAILLAWRLVFRPQQRRDVGLLIGAVLLVFVPLLGLGILRSLSPDLPFVGGGGALLTLPAVPGAYFYVLYRRQLGHRLARARRLVRLYVLAIVVSNLLLAVVGGVAIMTGLAGSPQVLQVGILLFFVLAAVLSFTPFLYLARLGDATAWETDPLASGLALRANRLLTPFLFAILGLLIVTLPLILLSAQRGFSHVLLAGGVVLALVWGRFGYRPLQEFVDRRLLGITLPPAELPARYAARITTSLDRLSLVQLLRDEILPSLLIRQSALLYLSETGDIDVILAKGLPDEKVEAYVQRCKTGSGADFVPAERPDWVYLMVPLQLGGRTVGCWLFGRRDPDDWYRKEELVTFQALADQTVIALTNIVQANRLHTLYQENIDRGESERNRLARALHDEVLNQLTVLAMHVDDGGNNRQFDEVYNALTARLREMISGLRPAMLPYGLRAALEEFADELSDRPGNETSILLDLPIVDTRYPARVEQHLFRIAQQAIENALEHAQAETIWIGGRLNAGDIELLVEDNGRGFPADQQFSLDNLLVDKHFGLVSMHERAEIIGANLQIESTPGNGTRVLLTWTAPDDASSTTSS